MFFDLSVDDGLVDPCRRYFDLSESMLLLFVFVYLFVMVVVVVVSSNFALETDGP